MEQRPHATSKMATNRLALQRCAKCPPGICSSTYPQKKTPAAPPACVGFMCSQRWERMRVGSYLNSVTSNLISGLQGAGDDRVGAKGAGLGPSAVRPYE